MNLDTTRLNKLKRIGGLLKFIPGQRFGKLEIIRRDGNDDKGRAAMWLCKCDCGNIVRKNSSTLWLGHTKSCGCYHDEAATTHGHTKGDRNGKSKTYCCWDSMIQRTTNPNNKRFKDYGGRGITVCERWLSFENFLADMGERPDGLTLDRKNNNEPYFPSNCRWATRSEQQRNRKCNRLLTFNGETHCVTEWAEIKSISIETLRARVKRNWSTERALMTP